MLVEVRVADGAVGAHLDRQRADVEQADVRPGRHGRVLERAVALAAGADGERLHAVDGAALVAVQVAGEDRVDVGLAEHRQDRVAGLQRSVADDEPDGRPGLAERRPGECDRLRIVRLVAEDDDLDRAVAHRVAAAAPGRSKALADRLRAGEERVVVAEAHVHRRVRASACRAG